MQHLTHACPCWPNAATFFTLALALARAARRLRSLELCVLLLVRRLGLFDIIVGISANPLELGFFFLEGGLGPLNLLDTA